MTDTAQAETLEELRWVREHFTFGTPEAFEQRRRERWVAPNTRGHSIDADGISREVRKGGTLRVDQRPGFASLIEGRTIVKFEREPDREGDWGQGENSVTITLDDGAVLAFVAYGYDASELGTSYAPPGEG